MAKNQEQQLRASCNVPEVLREEGPSPWGAGCMRVAFVHVLLSCIAPLVPASVMADHAQDVTEALHEQRCCSQYIHLSTLINTGQVN